MILNKSKKIMVFALIILLSTFVLPTLTLDTVKAQLSAQQPVSGPLPTGVTVDSTIPAVASISFRPNPIGIGQTLIVNMWITPGVSSNNRLIPQGYVITITKPDGTVDKRTISSEPATAASWFELVPDQLGTWQFKFDFLGTYFPAGYYYDGKVYNSSVTGSNLYGSAYYTPSSTQVQNLTVQQDMIWSWPVAAFPTDYWTRPASLNNREWWPILGNYPGDGYQGVGYPNWNTLYPDTNPYDSPGVYNFVPWVQAPNTAHIVWKRQSAIAGLIGGPATQYGITASPGTPSVVYSGRCYQTVTLANGTSAAQCYDLRTGKIYYEIPGGVTPAYIVYNNPVASSTTIAGNELGATSWSVELISISGSSLLKVNPLTGAVSNYSISPLSGGTFVNQLGGYVLSLQNIGTTANPQYRLINWTTRGTSTTVASRIVSNITWPWAQLPTNSYTSAAGMCVADFNAGIAAYITRTIQPGSNIYWTTNVTAASLTTGQLLPWKVVITDDTTYASQNCLADHGKVAFLGQRGYFYAYDLATGQLAWKSETMDYPWASNSFGAYNIETAYGMLFRQAYDGVYAFNWTNGKIVWHYKAPTPANFETPYIDNGTEVYSFNGAAEIADGKMYVYNTEHTPTWPLTRGWGLHCINITTGEGIWKINNPMQQGAIADGYLVAPNPWDGSLYVFGKGLSSTTVSMPQTQILADQKVVISGTVLDQSPAQEGKPCVSASSMATQMEYLHLQMPIGGLWGNETLTGVPVSLDAIDPNGNSVHIATVTSEGYSGTYAYTWTPSITGDYKITATFIGDDSYGSSFATAYATVAQAPSTTVTPTPIISQGLAANEFYPALIGATIAIIIAMAVVAVLLLRKKS
jgi:hypothetical protein